MFKISYRLYVIVILNRVDWVSSTWLLSVSRRCEPIYSHMEDIPLYSLVWNIRIVILFAGHSEKSGLVYTIFLFTSSEISRDFSGFGLQGYIILICDLIYLLYYVNLLIFIFHLSNRSAGKLVVIQRNTWYQINVWKLFVLRKLTEVWRPYYIVGDHSRG